MSSADTRPSLASMQPQTRELHEGIDANIRRTGKAFLHPDSATIQRDMLSSAAVVRWQEGKAEALFDPDLCWSELPPLYARYGTGPGIELIAALKELEGATAVLLCDSGMQATALAFDLLVEPRGHAVLTRQVYNKSARYLSWLCERIGASLTVVDDGDLAALEKAIEPTTTMLFCETFTNPLVRAQDLKALPALVARARATAPGLKLVVDNTMVTPWGLSQPLLSMGVDVVVASGTKALSGQDRDLCGYIATRDGELGNAGMDLLAMRGGILDWRRAELILEGLGKAKEMHAQRCHTATAIAAFLAEHPAVETVFHPSRHDHPDAEAIATTGYARHGSVISLRLRDAAESQARHFCDVLATTTVFRYALSFDGLASKVNHHKSVSEYFTPDETLKKQGIDRIVRLGIGLEDARDLQAALDWALREYQNISEKGVAQWVAARAADLGLQA